VGRHAKGTIKQQVFGALSETADGEPIGANQRVILGLSLRLAILAADLAAASEVT
jgi:hypothetical protein